jgi:hypothetical protein
MLEWGRDGEEVGFRWSGEVVDPVAIGEHLQLTPPVACVDGIRVSDRTHVADDESDRRFEGGLVHLVESSLGKLDSRFEQVLQQRLLR